MTEREAMIFSAAFATEHLDASRREYADTVLEEFRRVVTVAETDEHWASPSLLDFAQGEPSGEADHYSLYAICDDVEPVRNRLHDTPDLATARESAARGNSMDGITVEVFACYRVTEGGES